jgi:hypothetical protein
MAALLSLTFCQAAGPVGRDATHSQIFAGWHAECFQAYTKGDRQMEMLLMGACLSVFGLAVACLAFGAATRTQKEATSATPGLEQALVQEAVRVSASPARFFVDPPVLPAAAQSRMPIEALLLQIENHVRLEHAAAECFLESPNASLLHSRTISPLVN